MAGIEVTLTEEEIQGLFRGDRGVAQLLERVLNEVPEAEIADHLGAEPHQRSDGRRGWRNGHYERSLTTRLGTLRLRVPRDREGTFRTELFQRFQRSEKALVLALMEMEVNGVSTRKVRRITDELCGREFSRSTVSELTKGLDGQVEAWNERPLEGTTYPFLMADAMHFKVRRQGAARATSALLVIGVNTEGYREILGIRIANSETEPGWLETFRWLKARGLEGVDLMVSDAHEGLVEALHRCFQGASWQRCQAHFRRNVLDKTPAARKQAIARGLDRILEADTPKEARRAFQGLADRLEGQAGRALETLEAGAERGYNPKKPGRPSHHPLLAFVVETGDCLGVRWRPGSAWSGEGTVAWRPELVGRLRAAGVEEITVRLDKGFFSEDVVRCLQQLEVSYLLKIPNHARVRRELRLWRRNSRAAGIFEDAATVWTSTGRLWGGRLLSLEGRRPLTETEGTLALDTHAVTETAHILTDREGIHALTAWRAYNRSAAVEGRIKELGQLSVGRTAVDDLDGNALLWALGTVAYQLLHTIRSQALTGSWRRATPDRLRAWLFRLPGRFTRHARKTYLQLRGDEPLRGRLLAALRRFARLRAPPLPAAA